MGLPRLVAQNATRTGPRLVEVEVADRLAGVWSFFGLLDRLLKLLLQKVGSMFLGFNRLPEDGFTPAVLLFHGLGGGLHVGERSRLDGGCVGDHCMRF